MLTVLGSRYRAPEFKAGWVIKVSEHRSGGERDSHGTIVTRWLKICTVDIRRVDRIWFTVEDCSTHEFEVRSLGTLSLYERIEK